MAVAESVRPLDIKFNRLAIQDSDLKVWTYSEGRPAKRDAEADVQVEFGSVNLLRDSDQQVVLRQMASGLPKRIVVQFASAAGEGSGGGFGSWTGGGGTYEFEQD
jgi:hypothetical protein